MHQSSSWAAYRQLPTAGDFVAALPRRQHVSEQQQSGADCGHLGVYEQLAQSLVSGGPGLRHPPHRMGRWSTTYFSWGVHKTTPAQYVTAFDDIVTAMRSVPGQHFLFDWCAAADETPTNGPYAASYPGDQYVDYIGTDQYDNVGSS